ncbi:flagellin [Bacillus haikouensis]|uniref:flagellin N-terminal helical domain-containing protein n=1 Tax=Bacillus haikouensis TaxID=1510468 RepID=UPI0015534B3B|nr:flagellin [Bacillus haikouensis]NQD65113.1 flagellin [Bacillus haikouensis]
MRINHNIAALNTYRQLNSASNAQSKSMEKLSSGLRINRAGDDAAGLAISEKMRGQIRGLDMASKNAQDGISLIQTAEGALNESHSILQRMRELATQSANDTNTSTDRNELQKEVDQLAEELTRIADTTEFNTQNLLGEGFTGTFHIGANAEQNITLNINQMDATSLEVASTLTAATEDLSVDGVALTGQNTLQDDTGSAVAVHIDGDYYKLSDLEDDGSGSAIQVKDGAKAYVAGAAKADAENVTKGIDVSSQTSADSSITTINDAIESVSAERSKLGAYQNRLEHTINNLNTSSENLTAAESRVRDVDMAKEMMNQTKNSILSQAAQAMLAQSNQMPQGVLQLLR